MPDSFYLGRPAAVPALSLWEVEVGIGWVLETRLEVPPHICAAMDTCVGGEAQGSLTTLMMQQDTVGVAPSLLPVECCAAVVPFGAQWREISLV